jgi:hypothetical protein
MSGPASVFGIFSFRSGEIKNWFNVDNKQDLLGQVQKTAEEGGYEIK